MGHTAVRQERQLHRKSTCTVSHCRVQQGYHRKNTHDGRMDGLPASRLGWNSRCVYGTLCRSRHNQVAMQNRPLTHRLAIRNTPPTKYTTINIPESANLIKHAKALRQLICDGVRLATPIPKSVQQFTTNRGFKPTKHRLNLVEYTTAQTNANHTIG